MAGVAGFGTTLKIGGTAGTAVVNVTNIGGPNFGADKIDLSAHDSPSSWREVGVGMLDPGDITLDINWDPGTATHADTTGLLSYFTSRASASYALTFPDTGTTVYIFTAFVTSFQGRAPYEDKLQASVTLSLTGAPTLE